MPRHSFVNSWCNIIFHYCVSSMYTVEHYTANGLLNSSLPNETACYQVASDLGKDVVFRVTPLSLIIYPSE